MKIKNPIIPGFSPDASVLQVGKDYYLTTSTFEWWPGVEIYHSRDLVNWDLVDNPLTRSTQVNLVGNYNSGSIWAPHLSYAQGKFWLIYTDVKTTGAYKDVLNYMITADKIGGPWSERTFVSASGFDPCLFHDDDGKSYVINMLFDHRLDKPKFSGLVIQQYDLDKRKLVGERKHFFTGTNLGVCEGPQMLKKNGWYYLLCAAGGTGYSHAATVCRSRQVDGPYEISPYQPLMTTKTDPTNPLQKSGHASFVKANDQEWYIVHISARPLRDKGVQRGYCTLGRETSMQPLEWVGDWPRLKNRTTSPDLYIEAPSIGQNSVQKENYSQDVDFGKITQLPREFKSLRTALGKRASFTENPGYLRLHGAQTITSIHEQTLIARRFQAFDFRVETEMSFAPESYQQMAGLVLFYDTDNFEYLQMSFDEGKGQTYLQLEIAELGKHRYGSNRIYLPKGTTIVKLAAEVHKRTGQFYANLGQGWQKIGTETPVERISDDYITNNGKLAFTGAMTGICAQDMDQHTSFADFKYFNYDEFHEN